MISLMTVIIFSLFVSSEVSAMNRFEALAFQQVLYTLTNNESADEKEVRVNKCFALMPDEKTLMEIFCKNGVSDFVQKTAIIESLADQKIALERVMEIVQQSLSSRSINSNTSKLYLALCNTICQVLGDQPRALARFQKVMASHDDLYPATGEEVEASSESESDSSTGGWPWCSLF